jgi:hypothetical protein
LRHVRIRLYVSRDERQRSWEPMISDVGTHYRLATAPSGAYTQVR